MNNFWEWFKDEGLPALLLWSGGFLLGVLAGKLFSHMGY